MQFSRFCAVLGFTALLIAPPAWADSVTLNPSKDNSLYQDATGQLSNGAGEFLFAGRTAQGSNFLRRALLAFDVAGNVPAGSLIRSAELTLTVSNSISGGVNMELRTVSADWGEGASNASSMGGGGGAQAQTGDATWLHTFFSTSFWTTAGGDFAGTASATTSVAGTGDYTWGSTDPMVADVQSWLDAPASNFGWIVIGAEGTSGSAKRFNSRENADSMTVPRLAINYAPSIFADGFESGNVSAWSTSGP